MAIADTRSSGMAALGKVSVWCQLYVVNVACVCAHAAVILEVSVTVCTNTMPYFV